MPHFKMLPKSMRMVDKKADMVYNTLEDREIWSGIINFRSNQFVQEEIL
jgi:hypothetical protein